MSLEEFVESNYETRRHRTRPSEVQICCPFCGDEKFHGQLNVAKRVYYCYKCGLGASAYRFLSEAHRLDHPTIKSILRGEEVGVQAPAPRGLRAEDLMSRLDPPSTLEVEAELEEVELPEGCAPLHQGSSGRGIIGKRAVDYLKKRLGSRWGATALLYSLYYCASGQCSNRLVIPVFDRRKRLVYYQARALSAKQQPKYLNPSVENRPLYGLDHIGEGGAVYLVEGVFDVMAVGREAIGLLGSTLSRRAVDEIAALHPSRVIVATDPDTFEFDLERRRREIRDPKAKTICETLRRVLPGRVWVLDPEVWTRSRADAADLGPGARKIFDDIALPYTPMLFERSLLMRKGIA